VGEGGGTFFFGTVGREKTGEKVNGRNKRAQERVHVAKRLQSREPEKCP